MLMQVLESAARAVFHASWQAAILVLVVLVAGPLVPRMPSGAKSGLWLIVLAVGLSHAPQVARVLRSAPRMSLA